MHTVQTNLWSLQNNNSCMKVKKGKWEQHWTIWSGHWFKSKSETPSPLHSPAFCQSRLFLVCIVPVVNPSAGFKVFRRQSSSANMFCKIPTDSKSSESLYSLILRLMALSSFPMSEAVGCFGNWDSDSTTPTHSLLSLVISSATISPLERLIFAFALAEALEGSPNSPRAAASVSSSFSSNITEAAVSTSAPGPLPAVSDLVWGSATAMGAFIGWAPTWKDTLSWKSFLASAKPMPSKSSLLRFSYRFVCWSFKSLGWSHMGKNPAIY